MARDRAEMREHMTRLMEVVERPYREQRQSVYREAVPEIYRDSVKLIRLSKDNDIDAYLTTFKSVMTA